MGRKNGPSFVFQRDCIPACNQSLLNISGSLLKTTNRNQKASNMKHFVNCQNILHVHMHISVWRDKCTLSTSGTSLNHWTTRVKQRKWMTSVFTSCYLNRLYSCDGSRLGMTQISITEIATAGLWATIKDDTRMFNAYSTTRKWRSNSSTARHPQPEMGSNLITLFK